VSPDQVRVLGANEIVDMVFSGLAPLVVEEVADEGEIIRVRATTPDVPVDCPKAVVGPVGLTPSMSAS